jgi:two-component system, LytTR family, sensor kinase
MKDLIDIKRFKFYGWVGLAFLVIRLLADLAKDNDALLARVLDDIWAVSYVLVLNYVFFEYTLPRLTWKRILLSLLLLGAHLFSYSAGLYIWESLGIKLGLFTARIAFPSAGRAVEEQMAFSMGSVVFFGIIRHIYVYVRLKQTSQQLLIEKQQAELNYLKSQTNPHFLFNTLNNIYSLARDKSDLAPESILRLSKILRYMLYEAGGPFIAIEGELKIISDYLALEQLRYDDSLHINFNYDVEDMKQAMPPLLLIPLVENAFKHGVSETRDQPFVDIHLRVNKRQLAFVVKNSTEVVPDGNVKENIGLSNLRRQLELLYTDSNLSVRQDHSAFTATLTINLASHV